MDPLSPRSTNIKVLQKLVTKQDGADVANAKLALAAKKAQKERDHAAPPPPIVYQPEGPSGEPAEKYRTGRLLGKGGFAICHEGELRGKRYGSRVYKFALKIVNAEMSQKKMQDKFRTELQIHSKMRHPNIVEFHRAFTFEASTYVVLELCPNGSVMDMVKKRKCLSLPEVRRFAVQLCGAIKYMHARDVIHRDLKMGNLFLDHEMNLKIGDFGLAAILVSESDVKGFSRRQTMCGTPNYIAPEILEKAKKGHDHKVDIWAVGVILFAMLTGIPPFQSNTQEEIYRKVRKIDYVWPEHASCTNFIPSEAKALVSMLLRVDAAERPDPDHIVAHPFFSMRDTTNSQYSLIPKRLGTECRQQKPVWLMPCIPNGDVMGPDSDRISLEELCRECGVGHLKDKAGNDLGVLDVVGTDVKKSLYKEFIEEANRGLTPIVPLPAETVYISHPILDSWPSARGPRKEANGPKMDAVGTKTASSEPAQVAVPTLPKQAGNPSKSAPLSHAAQLRSQASRQPSQTVGRASARVVSVNNDTLKRARNAGSIISSVNSATGLLNNIPLRSTQQHPLDPDRQSQTLPRRLGRVTRSVTSGSNRDVGASVSATAATTRISRSASARITRNGPGMVTGQANSDKEREEAAINTKARIAATVGEEMLEVAKVRRGPLPALPREGPESKSTNGVLIGPDEMAECLPSTMPDVILSALELFHKNLEAALNNPYSPPACTTLEGRLASDRNSKDDPNRPDSLKGRPVVIKWVDYTNKFGIGYILANGSVGCVFKGEDGKPPTCVIVHGGEDHLRRRKLTTYSERHQIVPTGGIPIDPPEPPHKPKRTPSRPFIKFYQRLGNVGIWAFGSGSLQFNFPDHTKLVLSADAAFLDFYHLPLHAARRLAAGQPLPADALDARTVLSLPVADMLHGGDAAPHGFGDVVAANELRGKLRFVGVVVGVWRENGGLGRMGEGLGKRLMWEGVVEKGRVQKLVWVTVGACGGDGAYEQVVPEGYVSQGK
ncbi:MAG: PLK kinase [Lasallia pustulata]|uniref:PLK kinase n=1 Tax=Lasallia pustulata TaxID=136370 RepID=A0A5M8Q3G6_9LECA|nr:MAG: PLK kinase [Lasallia pustulata]